MSLTKWDERFLAMADLVASWSKDSTKVGAVIADEKNRVVSVGFNGFPVGVDDTILDRDQKLRRTIHSEMNAAAFANRDLVGCRMYVTHPPCANCAAMIVQRGITKVVFRRGDAGFMERWKENYEDALAMFSEAGLEVVEVVVRDDLTESEGGTCD